MNTQKTQETKIGFDAIKEMTISQVIELEKQAGGNQDE